jgi:mRNA interferase MazF
MQRGEIWEVHLPAPPGGAGREQAGIRPALIVTLEPNPANPMSMVIPLTSRQSALRFPYTLMVDPSPDNGLTKASVLLVFQLRALDKQRLVRRLGILEQESLAVVDHLISELLAL